MEFTTLKAPQSTEIEQVVLGAIILENDAINEVIDILTPNSFYDDKHKVVYEAIVKLYNERIPIDMATVTKKVYEMKKLESIGGAYFIASLTNRIASSANIVFHARIIQQDYILREIASNSTYITKKSFEQGVDAFELHEEALDRIQKITQGIIKNKLRSISEVRDEIIEELNLSTMAPKLAGIPSGIKWFDDHTGGFRESRLYIFAGRPGMGKTSVVLCMGVNAAKKGFPVGMFSHEMRDVELIEKVLSAESGVSSDRINKKIVTNSEITQIHFQSKSLDGVPFYIDDTPNMTVNQVKSAARKMVREKNIKMIIVDYLQLESGSNEYRGNREQEISYITRNLKIISRELNIPVIAISQLSREVDKRPNKEPLLSDLRESGAIEQDADMVLFPYRPEYYNDNSQTHYTIGNDNYPIHQLMVLIIAKFRGGSLGKVPCKWINYLTKIENYDKSDQSI